MLSKLYIYIEDLFQTDFDLMQFMSINKVSYMYRVSFLLGCVLVSFMKIVENIYFAIFSYFVNYFILKLLGYIKWNTADLSDSGNKLLNIK